MLTLDQIEQDCQKTTDKVYSLIPKLLTCSNKLEETIPLLIQEYRILVVERETNLEHLSTWKKEYKGQGFLGRLLSNPDLFQEKYEKLLNDQTNLLTGLKRWLFQYDDDYFNSEHYQNWKKNWSYYGSDIFDIKKAILDYCRVSFILENLDKLLKRLEEIESLDPDIYHKLSCFFYLLHEKKSSVMTFDRDEEDSFQSDMAPKQRHYVTDNHYDQVAEFLERLSLTSGEYGPFIHKVVLNWLKSIHFTLKGKAPREVPVYYDSLEESRVEVINWLLAFNIKEHSLEHYTQQMQLCFGRGRYYSNRIESSLKMILQINLCSITQIEMQEQAQKVNHLFCTWIAEINKSPFLANQEQAGRLQQQLETAVPDFMQTIWDPNALIDAQESIEDKAVVSALCESITQLKIKNTEIQQSYFRFLFYKSYDQRIQAVEDAFSHLSSAQQIREEIANQSSELYCALNTHNNRFFPFTIQGCLSSETKTLIDLKQEIARIGM